MINIKKEWRNAWGVYVIINKINNKRYVGSSKTIHKRLYGHIRYLRLNKHPNIHLQSAWNKYGEDNFECGVLELINTPELKNNRYLRDRETFYIRDFKSYIDDFGYNIVPGGIGTLGQTCPEETRRKISESNKGKTAWNKGLPMSEEQKKESREEKRKVYGKYIDIYDNIGNFIETMQGVRAIHRKYNVSRSIINGQCRGIRKDGKRYIFRYHGDPLNKFGDIFKYVVVDKSTGKILLECKFLKDVIKFINPIVKTRDKSIELPIRKNCNNPGNKIEIKNKYIVSLEIAPNISNNISESRQPINIGGGIDLKINANGET